MNLHDETARSIRRDDEKSAGLNGHHRAILYRGEDGRVESLQLGIIFAHSTILEY